MANTQINSIKIGTSQTYDFNLPTTTNLTVASVSCSSLNVTGTSNLSAVNIGGKLKVGTISSVEDTIIKNKVRKINPEVFSPSSSNQYYGFNINLSPLDEYLYINSASTVSSFSRTMYIFYSLQINSPDHYEEGGISLMEERGFKQISLVESLALDLTGPINYISFKNLQYIHNRVTVYLFVNNKTIFLSIPSNVLQQFLSLDSIYISTGVSAPVSTYPPVPYEYLIKI